MPETPLHRTPLRLFADQATPALEPVVPIDVCGLGIGRQRDGFFNNASGGTLDDLMITRHEGDVLVVVDAGPGNSDAAGAHCADAVHAPRHFHGRPPNLQELEA